MTSQSSAVSRTERRVRNWLRSAAAFWYDFVIGDDWRGAAVVAVALAGTGLLAHVARVDAWWLVPAGVLAALGWSLRRATRRTSWRALPGRDGQVRPDRAP